jgi:flavodoxin
MYHSNCDSEEVVKGLTFLPYDNGDSVHFYAREINWYFVEMTMKCLLVVYSYHHNNTEKVAKVFARVLNAEIKTPQEVEPNDLQGYDLVGFGSGIYGEKHHKYVLDLADGLPQVTNKRTFIFSTSAIMGEKKVAKDHATLREKLQSKGYVIVDEFACRGFNTNSFMRYLGGMNKGRPNAEDLKHAEEFAESLKHNLE